MQNRREKIADRMKNLQELVPNSNKVHTYSVCLIPRGVLYACIFFSFFLFVSLYFVIFRCFCKANVFLQSRGV